MTSTTSYIQPTKLLTAARDRRHPARRVGVPAAGRRLPQRSRRQLPPHDLHRHVRLPNRAPGQANHSRGVGRITCESATKAVGISPERVKAALELVQGVEVTPKDDVVETADDQEALNAARIRRSAFRFSSAGIPIGAPLTSTFDDTLTCIVVDDRRVEFRGQVTSLSDAALHIAHENGFTWKAIQGPAYWLYEGAPLDELRQSKADASDEAA